VEIGRQVLDVGRTFTYAHASRFWRTRLHGTFLRRNQKRCPLILFIVTSAVKISLRYVYVFTGVS